MFGIFRKSPEQQALEAETTQFEAQVLLAQRHERVVKAKMDPGTWLLILQFFDPLAVALLELLLKRLGV